MESTASSQFYLIRLNDVYVFQLGVAREHHLSAFDVFMFVFLNMPCI